MHTAHTAGTVAGDRASSTPDNTRRRTMIVPIRPPVVTGFRPGHTEGDSDFSGHGPFVHIVTHVQRNGNVLVLNTSAFFQESESDWTTFEGSISQSFYDARVEHPGWRIQSIGGDVHQSIQLVLGGFGRHSFHYGTTGLVNSMVLRGDSDSGVYGGHDRPEIISMQFNELQVELVRG
jgi:hypothetical protein